MNLFARFNFGGREILLIVTLVLMLLAARKLPEIARALGFAFDEFAKATRDLFEEISKRTPPKPRPNHPVLMTATFLLATVSVVLVLYEFSR